MNVTQHDMLISQKLAALRAANASQTATELSPERRLALEAKAIMRVMADHLRTEVVMPWESKWGTVINGLATALPVEMPIKEQTGNQLVWRFARLDSDGQYGETLQLDGYIGPSFFTSPQREECVQALEVTATRQTFVKPPGELLGVKPVKDRATKRYSYPNTPLRSKLSEVVATNHIDRLHTRSDELGINSWLENYDAYGSGRREAYQSLADGGAVYLRDRDPDGAERSEDIVWGVIEDLSYEERRTTTEVEAYLQTDFRTAQGEQMFRQLGAVADFLSREDVSFITSPDAILHPAYA